MEDAKDIVDSILIGDKLLEYIEKLIEREINDEKR